MKQNDSEILERRQEELQARLDPRWQPDTEFPVLSPGNIQYEISARAKGIKYGGLGLVVELVKNIGLENAGLPQNLWVEMVSIQPEGYRTTVLVGSPS